MRFAVMLRICVARGRRVRLRQRARIKTGRTRRRSAVGRTVETVRTAKPATGKPRRSSTNSARVVWKEQEPAVVELRLNGPDFINADLAKISEFKSLNAITPRAEHHRRCARVPRKRAGRPKLSF